MYKCRCGAAELTSLIAITLATKPCQYSLQHESLLGGGALRLCCGGCMQLCCEGGVVLGALHLLQQGARLLHGHSSEHTARP